MCHHTGKVVKLKVFLHSLDQDLLKTSNRCGLNMEEQANLGWDITHVDEISYTHKTGKSLKRS